MNNSPIVHLSAVYIKNHVLNANRKVGILKCTFNFMTIHSRPSQRNINELFYNSLDGKNGQ